MTTRRADPAWRVVVPVKQLDGAKSRLAPDVGALRADLALAMALDTVAATQACPEVAAVIVVTDDLAVSRALAGSTVTVVPDEPRRGINAALQHGASIAVATAPPASPSAPMVAALAADLPALRAAELSAALRVARRHPRSFVADAAGTGTTLYAARSVEDFTPQFGSGSAQRHRSDAVVLDLEVPSLRRDVDTIDDLWRAIHLGVGARTAQLQRFLPARPA